MLLTLDQLEKEWPSIKWREPIPITTPSAVGLGCRVCIVTLGLQAVDVADLPQTRRGWDTHFKEHLVNSGDREPAPASA